MKKFFTLVFIFASLFSFSQSTTIVISQVYSGGGTNTGPVTYFTDFVELHNISSAPQNLTLYSIQYGSSTGNFGNTGGQKFKFPDGTIMPPGSFLMIQVGAPGTAGANFPVTPDFITGNAAMGATTGKVALINDTTGIGCGATATACTLPAANIIDLVAWGTSNNAEGGTAVPDLSKTTGAVRKLNGCQDTDNNAADFDVMTDPIPRNSASPAILCGPAVPTLIAGTVVDFGNVLVGTNSASQTFNLSGTDLTGAPGTISITAPSTDFQVSNDNTTWGATTTIPYTTATLSSTPVYVRFTPQTAGPKSGNVSILGGGISTAVNVAVSGNGIVGGVATVTVGAGLAGFGSVCVNTTPAPNSFTITGANLTTADIIIGPLSGFTFSTTAGGTYTSTLTLVHGAGTYSQEVFVKFTPTAVISYNGNIAVTGGGLASTVNVPVTGSGVNNTATVLTGAASVITSSTATLAGSLPDGGCSPVTAYGFEYSLIMGFSTGTVAPSTNLSGTTFSTDLMGLLPSTTYYYKAFATNGGGTVYGIEMSFTTLTPSPAGFFATNLSIFGSSCVNVASGPNAFDITGNNLTTADIIIGPLAGYSFSTSVSGTFTPTLTLTQPGGNFTATIFVKFTPSAIGDFNGSIPVNGGGVAAFAVPVSGTGSNNAPTASTGEVVSVLPYAATAKGAVTNAGCSPVISYGIEYSGISGFVNGSGIKAVSADPNSADYSTQLTRLVPASTYYYKAYAVNDGGTGYGEELSFKTAAMPEGFIIYSNPVTRGQNFHFSLTGINPGHYSIRLLSIVGQVVFRRDIIVQVNFIDDNFIVPIKLSPGIYNMEMRNDQFLARKSFMVR